MNLVCPAFFYPSFGEMLLVLAIVLLLFGKRLPGVMNSLGRSLVEFKKGVKDGGKKGDRGRKEPKTIDADEAKQAAADETTQNETTHS